MDAMASILRATRDGAPKLSSDGAHTIRATYWALDPGGAVIALSEALPRIVAQLERTTTRVHERSPSVRGRIDWPRTVQARLRRSVAAEAFDVRRVLRNYDTRENQLLVHVLRRALTILDVLPQAALDGLLVSAVRGVPLIQSVAAVVRTLVAQLRDRALWARLSQVHEPELLDNRWFNAADAAAEPGYRVAKRAYETYGRNVEAPSRRGDNPWRELEGPGYFIVPATGASGSAEWIAVAALRVEAATRLNSRR